MFSKIKKALELYEDGVYNLGDLETALENLTLDLD